MMNAYDLILIIGIAIGIIGTLLVETLVLLIWLLINRKEDDDDSDDS